MGVVRDGRAALLLTLFAASAVLVGCSANREAAVVDGLTGRARAEALVDSYARHVGAVGRGLDGGDDVALGESGLHYDETRNVLIGRAFVQRVYIEDAPPDELINYRRMVGVLNDPNVGGKYDRAGGTFVLDEPRNGYFLVREFPVDGTEAATLTAAMDAMIGVSARWVTTWLREVALVMHGQRPPPEPQRGWDPMPR